ncbi:hypothetical protein LOZ39_006883 [Ophidiomyces ophidiicola]|uniref:Uncharacterized protein n=1 Tax=Ophidiomyces ophidiicola TaxID=1387563 RepID=A0ACB8ULI2_9EURO
MLSPFSAASPSDALLDLRASTSCSLTGRNTTCAFPSWPNRAALFDGHASDAAPASAFLSDEDLLGYDAPSPVCVPVHPTWSCGSSTSSSVAGSLTTEEQVSRVQAAARDGDAAVWAHVHAQTRAHQALRAAQQQQQQLQAAAHVAQRRKRRVSSKRKPSTTAANP